MKPRRRVLVAAGAIAVLAVFGGVALASGDDSTEDVAEGPDVAITGNAYEAASKAALEDDDEGETDHPEAIAGEDEGAENAAEDQREGADVAITGDPLTKASATALEMVQQELGQSGRVSATEVGDEESYYEVEVTLEDGSQVDVQLDENFNFVGFD